MNSLKILRTNEFADLDLSMGTLGSTNEMRFGGGLGAATNQGNTEGEGVMSVNCLGTGGNPEVIWNLLCVTTVAGKSTQNC